MSLLASVAALAPVPVALADRSGTDLTAEAGRLALAGEGGSSSGPDAMTFWFLCRSLGSMGSQRST
jgi:hypothetical protein